MGITCRDFIDFLMAYLAGDLPGDQQSEFDRHLALCPSCVAYLRTYEQTVRLGKTAFREDDGAVPEDVPEELVQAILATRARSR
jgi:anti-sigma factor RsiW